MDNEQTSKLIIQEKVSLRNSHCELPIYLYNLNNIPIRRSVLGFLDNQFNKYLILVSYFWINAQATPCYLISKIPISHINPLNRISGTCSKEYPRNMPTNPPIWLHKLSTVKSCMFLIDLYCLAP